jgi:hypothetical protein
VANPGAQLLLWDAGEWKQLDTNTAPPSSPGQLSWSSSDDPAWNSLDEATRRLRLRRLLFGGDRTVGLALSPAASNGPGDGTDRYGWVAVDHVEAVLDYRLPVPP